MARDKRAPRSDVREHLAEGWREWADRLSCHHEPRHKPGADECFNDPRAAAAYRALVDKIGAGEPVEVAGWEIGEPQLGRVIVNGDGSIEPVIE